MPVTITSAWTTPGTRFGASERGSSPHGEDIREPDRCDSGDCAGRLWLRGIPPRLPGGRVGLVGPGGGSGAGALAVARAGSLAGETIWADRGSGEGPGVCRPAGGESHGVG